MKIKNPMLVVKNIDKSVEFYKKVLGLRVIMDFGANKTLTGGLSLQTLDTWKEFIDADTISFGSNSYEIYFEEDDFDNFMSRLQKYDVKYVHPIKEHSWGQRVIRIYDPDQHIIEVGENLKMVCKRFLDSGLNPEKVAEKMDVPMKFVKACMR
ncbi:VOC family protein [Floccifex sp.]|uniref:VOC family protein n=1 Tax=Floccifex sp. TaxID=2815810 RepID=UPI003F0A99F9